MKAIRTFEPVSHDWYCQQKTTFLLDDEEVSHFDEMLDGGKFEDLENEIKYELGLHDKHSRFDGDRYEVYWFYRTSQKRITIVNEWGYAV